MNTTQLINEVAKKTGKPKAEIKRILDAITETISATLEKGDRITLIGFGTWDVQDVPARTGRNPRTGEPLKIQAKKKIRFKAGSELSGKVTVKK